MFYVVRTAIRKVRKVKLTFILCFSSNSNVFYLYRATSAACSSTPYTCTCTTVKGVWLLYHYPAMLLF